MVSGGVSKGRILYLVDVQDGFSKPKVFYNGWVSVGVIWVAPEVVDGNLVAWSPIGAFHATQETNDVGEQAELFEYLFETLSYQIPELGPGSLHRSL